MEQENQSLALDGDIAALLQYSLVAIVFVVQFLGITAKGLDDDVVLVNISPFRVRFAVIRTISAKTIIPAHDC